MTAIPILNGDWEILLDDEKNMDGGTGAVAGMRTIRKAVASPTIVTTRTLYSAVAEAMDDFVAMGFRNSMLPTTPNAYTLENYYFMPRSSAEFLKEGAITADWTLAASREGDGVLKVVYTVGAGADFISTDIGRQVVQDTSGDTGTLLDFDQDPNGDLVAWIRPDDPSVDTFATTNRISVQVDGGAGDPDSIVAGISGTTQWSAVQAIGAVPTATEVYIYQNRIKLPSSDGTFQWWATDPDVSLGIISILVQVINSGETIAEGDVEVFARRYTALYDNFRLNVVGGGFSALPLASAPDINNTTGYQTAVLSGATSSTWEVGNGIYVGATWATATARGVVTAVTDFATTTPTLEYYLVGDLTDLANTDTVTEYDFDTAADGDGDGTVNGAPTATSGGPTDAAAGEGGSVVFSIGGFLVDHDGDGTSEPYSIEVDAQGDVPIAKVYERIKYATRRGATTGDLFSLTGVPGESYRGLSGVYEYDANTGALTDGELLSNDAGTLEAWTGYVLHQNTTWGDGTYVTVTDEQTSIDSVANDNVLLGETSGSDVTVHSAGTVGFSTFTSPKSSPLGTFTGTQIFGARGVVYVNPDGNDTQAYILTDDVGVLNSPPNTVTFTVTNTLALDRVLVARDTGTDGIIDKDQFGGIETPAGSYNQQGNSIIRVAGNIDSEVPASGYVRVVENALRQEHKYEYSSRTSGGAVGTDEFTLTAIPGGTATVTDVTGPVYTLTAGASTFVTDGVQVGMLIRNTITSDVFEVVSVDSETVLQTVELHTSGGSGWTNTNTFVINDLIQTYATSDDLYDLIIDAEATTTSISNSFIQSTLFDVVVNVRQGKVILPFTLNQAQGTGNTTVTVVRQPDTIAV